MLHFNDDCYEKAYIDHKRIVIRAILLDENNKVVLEKLIRDDIFSHCKYVETPGGGLNKGETHIECLKREILEELGYEIDVIKKIEVVNDYYNLIHRENENHYYLARILSKKEKHLEEHEKIMFQGEVHVDFDTAISLMKENTGGVGKLVAQREIPVLEIAKKMCEVL